MSLNTLAQVEGQGSGKPRPGMKKYQPSQTSFLGAVGQAVAAATGLQQNVWLDRSSTAEFREVFEIPDVATGKKRKVQVEASIGIVENDVKLGALIEQLLDGKDLQELVSTHVQTIVTRHIHSATELEQSTDPVFPARKRCSARITKRLEDQGLRLDTGVRTMVLPHVEDTNVVLEFKDFRVTPRGGSKRQPIHLIATLNAPSRSNSTSALLCWYLNETPIRGSSNSIEATIRAELTSRLDNKFTPQRLRRDTRHIREEVEADLRALIATQYGFELSLNIFEDDRPTETYRFNRTITIKADLLGTGREAEFEVEYTLNVFDEERFEGARAADRDTAKTKAAAGEELEAKLLAAQKGNTRQWAYELIKTIVVAELRQALSETPTAKLPALGILPEDPSLNPDERVNELIGPIFERYGASVKIRTASVVDPRLHQLRSGIPIETQMRKYDLSVTTLQPEMRFSFNVFMPNNANTRLLNQYFQAKTNFADPFSELKKTLIDRIENVAAGLVIRFDADEYLNRTGDRKGLVDNVEAEFQKLLEQEFGLDLRPPLKLQRKPDRVEERYIQMRNENRKVEIPIPAKNQTTGVRTGVRLSVRYLVERIVNPNVESGATEHEKEGWERFRSMALKHETLDAHLSEFEEVIGDHVKSRLKRVPAEALSRAGIDSQKDKIIGGLHAAGTYFGLKIQVFGDTLDVDANDEDEIGEPRAITRSRARIERLENILAEAEEAYDNAVHGLEQEEPASFIGFDPDDNPDEDDEVNVEAKLERQIEKLEASIEKETLKLTALVEKQNVALPSRDENNRLDGKEMDADERG